jgi:hypothetical protein
VLKGLPYKSGEPEPIGAPVRSASLVEERRFEPAVRFEGKRKKISKAHRQFESLSL